MLAAEGIEARPVLHGGVNDWAERGGDTVAFRRCGSCEPSQAGLRRAAQTSGSLPGTPRAADVDRLGRVRGQTLDMA